MVSSTTPTVACQQPLPMMVTEAMMVMEAMMVSSTSAKVIHSAPAPRWWLWEPLLSSLRCKGAQHRCRRAWCWQPASRGRWSSTRTGCCCN
eukprot:8696350-Lingulodinium_polyedra.AAC.1